MAMDTRIPKCFSAGTRWRKCLLGIMAGFLVFADSAQGAPPQNDAILPAIGGIGGGFFTARCPQGALLTGFELWTGDDIDAIRPLCVDADGAPAKFASLSWYGGPGGGLRTLRCPSGEPIVTGMFVGMAVRPVVATIHLFCGGASALQTPRMYPAAKYEGQLPTTYEGTQHCPTGLVGVGITGRHGIRLDAVGLTCGLPPTLPTQNGNKGQLPPLKEFGGITGTAQPRAGGAGAKQPAATSGWVGAQTPTSPGPPADQNALAAKGEAIANEDPLVGELRSRQPEGPSRRGFDIGIAAAEGQTAPGAGKQRIHDALSPEEQPGFDIAVAFSLERNRNIKNAKKGAAVVAADPIVAEARIIDADVFYWLGFDIATGIFGDPALGGNGNTSLGEGSTTIRSSLSPAGQRGFDAAVALHLSRNYRP